MNLQWILQLWHTYLKGITFVCFINNFVFVCVLNIISRSQCSRILSLVFLPKQNIFPELLSLVSGFMNLCASLSRFYAIFTDFNFLPFLCSFLANLPFSFLKLSFENLRIYKCSFDVKVSMKISSLIMPVLLQIFNISSFTLRSTSQKC